MKAKLVKESLIKNVNLNIDEIHKIVNIISEIIKSEEENEGRKMPKAYFMSMIDDIIDDIIDSEELNANGPVSENDILKIKKLAYEKTHSK